MGLNKNSYESGGDQIMTTLRHLTSEDFEEVYNLNLYAFHFKHTTESKEKMQKEFEYGSALGSFSGEQLTSSLILFPFEVYYHGQVFKMGGIGNVTSYPEVRGQGQVRQLMTANLKEMKDKGMVLSYLAPFSYHFYRKFGYEVTFEERQYDIKPEDFGSFKAPEQRVKRVRWEDHKEEIKAVYAEKMMDAIGPVKRNSWIWDNRIMVSKEKKLALYEDKKGAAKGYVLYGFSGENQNRFEIKELMALTGDAEQALWTFIGSHAAGFENFSFSVRSDQKLSHLFREARLEQKMEAGMMVRIVDMENFLKQFPFKGIEKQTFYLNVTDETAEWNDKVFKLVLNEGNISVRTVDEPEDKTFYMKASIQTWTQLFMQYKKAADLRFEGSLDCTREAAHALQSLLPADVPELHDFF
ncbi:Acetyltransferase [Alkalibacterium sp. AK22]|uniref:GNAT family N-acetyltransferase n=1 Tax=Alkalibacterium sp. AK22 TaxID=1229520 RepID=UPI0004510076|nr:GNAT family N-acetyltransferase [Alkalibacterium sp. AK22]EXJ23725.1 Acetyltransferase [Alkalibacterium sp. AK22]